jgi:hypothetical protein
MDTDKTVFILRIFIYKKEGRRRRKEAYKFPSLISLSLIAASVVEESWFVLRPW